MTSDSEKIEKLKEYFPQVPNDCDHESCRDCSWNEWSESRTTCSIAMHVREILYAENK